MTADGRVLAGEIALLSVVSERFRPYAGATEKEGHTSRSNHGRRRSRISKLRALIFGDLHRLDNVDSRILRALSGTSLVHHFKNIDIRG